MVGPRPACFISGFRATETCLGLFSEIPILFRKTPRTSPEFSERKIYCVSGVAGPDGRLLDFADLDKHATRMAVQAAAGALREIVGYPCEDVVLFAVLSSNIEEVEVDMMPSTSI